MSVNGETKERSTPKDLSTFISGASLFYLGVSVTSSLWFGVTVGTPTILGLILFAAFVSGLMLLVLNILMLALLRGRRLMHGVFVLLVVAAFVFFDTARTWHIDKRHQWFAENAMASYEEMAQKVLQHREVLQREAIDLKDLVTRPEGVYGRSNEDGSLLILFPGGDRGPRHGVLYFSGGVLATNPVHAGEPILHLTNGWHEY